MASSTSFSSSAAVPTFLKSNIGSLISIKLENHNYPLWKSLFLFFFFLCFLSSSMVFKLNPSKSIKKKNLVPSFSLHGKRDYNTEKIDKKRWHSQSLIFYTEAKSYRICHFSLQKREIRYRRRDREGIEVEKREI